MGVCLIISIDDILILVETRENAEEHAKALVYSSGHKKVPVLFLLNVNAKWTLNAQCTNGECFKNGR